MIKSHGYCFLKQGYSLKQSGCDKMKNILDNKGSGVTNLSSAARVQPGCCPATPERPPQSSPGSSCSDPLQTHPEPLRTRTLTGCPGNLHLETGAGSGLGCCPPTGSPPLSRKLALGHSKAGSCQTLDLQGPESRWLPSTSELWGTRS